MNKMIALVDFNEMDGDFKKDDTFDVNDERALVLTRLEKARRLTSDEVAKLSEPATSEEESETALADADIAPTALRIPPREQQ